MVVGILIVCAIVLLLEIYFDKNMRKNKQNKEK